MNKVTSQMTLSERADHLEEQMMHELNQKPSYCEFIESYLMNSCKCVALFPPK